MNNNNNKYSHEQNPHPDSNNKLITVTLTECTFIDSSFKNTLSISEEVPDEESAISFAETLAKDLVGVSLDMWNISYKNIGNFYSYNEVNKKYKLCIQY